MTSPTLSASQLASIMQYLADEQGMSVASFANSILSKIEERDKKLRLLASELSTLSARDRQRVLDLSARTVPDEALLCQQVDAPTSAVSANGQYQPFKDLSAVSLQGQITSHEQAGSQAVHVRGQTETDQKACPSVIAEGLISTLPPPLERFHVKPVSGIHGLSYFLDFSISELTRTKPSLLIINGESFKVGSWKDLALQFVRFLAHKKELCRGQLPLRPNPRSRKAFVNFFPGQPPDSGRSGLFEKALEGFYVDIKFNARYHIMNIKNTLDFLGLAGRYDVKIAVG